MYKRKMRRFPALEWTEENTILENDPVSSQSISEVASDLPSSSGSEPTFQDLVKLMYSFTSNVVTRSGSQNMGTEILPEFYPDSKTQDVKKWLRKVEEIREIYKWSELTTIYNATTKLRGLAKTWYQSLPSVNYSWEEWKIKLIKAFPVKSNYCHQLEEMLHRKKQSNETLMQYYYEKLALLNLCDISGENAVSCIINGLGDDHLQTTATVGEYKDPEELLKFLKNVTTCPDKRNFQQRRIHRRESLKASTTTKSWQQEKRRCYGCGGRDHLLPACPKREPAVQKMNKNSRTHGSERPKESRQVMAVKESGNSGSKYFMEAYINGKVVRAFVDLGSSCNTIIKSKVEELGLQTVRNIKSIKGYGGGIFETLGETKEVKVKIDQAEAETTFDIVPDEKQKIHVIIGQPFTEQDSIIIFKNNEILRICQNTLELLPDVVDLPPLKIPIWAKNSIIIPPRESKNILCHVNYEGDICIESSIRTQENNEYCIPRCVVKGKNKEVIIPVINPTNREVEIKTKQIFARGESCLEEEFVLTTCSKNQELNIDEINIGPEIDKDQRDQLKELLERFAHCFSTSVRSIGMTDVTEMKLVLRDDKPVCYKPYKMSPKERSKVKEIVNELLQCGIIRESNSPYSSPVLLVKKKNGDQRLCIDYRKLNSKLVQDRYPLPRIEDQLNALHGYHYYTTLDMTSGYYQVPMEEESKNKTSFITCDGQYEFNRMPFGLSTAPSVFQRMINKVLGPLRGTIAMAYLDDILIPSTSFEDGMERLKNVLDAIARNTLTLNPRKCNFFQTSITYLGFEVSKEGMRPGAEKTKSIVQFPEPQNVHQIRQFMGLTGFFRQFIKDYAIISRPLTQLTRKNVKWVWGREQQEAFDNLRRTLSDRPVLAIYNCEAYTEVHTDASKLGVAGIILQGMDKHKMQPVAYYSRQTTPAEENYHSYELETLAVVETLKKLRVYLLDLEFVVVTDCNAIKASARKKDLVPKIARWWLLIQEFNFTVEHRPGVRMQHVDALSRNAIENDSPISEEEEPLIFNIEVADWVLASQLTDEKLQHIREILQKKAETNYEKSIHKEYCIDNERIYRITKQGKLWVIPKGMRRQIVKSAHDDFGHFSLEKTLNKICETYWFPQMRQYVTKYIKSCIPCLYHKRPTGKRQGFLHPIEKSTTPFHTIHMDHLGPFNRSSSGKKYLIVAVESTTKYTMLRPVKDTKTAPVINFLESIIDTFGVPNRLITDRGTCYTSHNFKRFCENKGIKHIQTAVATPRANGQVERFNSTILASLAKSCQNDIKWDKEVPKIQFAINNIQHSITKRTPSELLFGYKPRSVSDAQLSNEVQENRPRLQEVSGTRNEVKERVEKEQVRQKTIFDRKRLRAHTYKEGDLVLAKKNVTTEGQSRKLVPGYKGPFRIKRVLPNDRYVIEELPGSNRSKRAKFDNVESVEHLIPWVPSGGVSSCDNEDEYDTVHSDGDNNSYDNEGEGKPELH